MSIIIETNATEAFYNLITVRMIKLFKGFLFDFIHIIQGTVIIPIK